MNEKQYQSMYRHICLSEEQKNRIREKVQNAVSEPAAGRKARFTLRGAVCVCSVLVVSGITVLAANSSYIDRIGKAMGFFTGRGEETAQEQRELYAAYADEMEHGWVSGAGEVRIVAALYDRGHLCIPFTLYPDRELMPGADILSEPVYQELLEGVTGQDCYFQKAGGEIEDFSWFTQIDPVVQEDGTLTGSFLIVNHTEEGFVQGDAVQLVRHRGAADGEPCGRRLEDGEDAAGLRTFEIEVNGETVPFVDLTPEDEVLAELRLESEPVPEMEICTKDIRFPYGIRADKITISSLALYLYGTGDDREPASKLSYNIWVVLKDGSVVERSDNSGSMGIVKKEEGHECDVSFIMTFADAVNLDEIAGVRITDRGEEICYIPAGNESKSEEP